MEAVEGRPGFAWEGGGECAACQTWEGSQGDLFAFLLIPCCLDGWHQLVHGAAGCWGNSQDLTLELQQRLKPWLCCCSGSILLGRWLQLLLLSLLSPPQYEPCSSSSSKPCLLHSAGGIVLPWGCRSFPGHSCWEGPTCYPGDKLG